MTQTIQNLLGKTPEFRAILDKSAYLLALQRHLVAVLPDYLAQSSQVSGLQFGVLSVMTRNGTIAAKLRQLAPELAAQLRLRGCEVSGIHVKVQVAYAPQVVKAAPRLLTSPAQQAFQALSQQLADSPLKEAVEKMLHSNQ